MFQLHPISILKRKRGRRRENIEKEEKNKNQREKSQGLTEKCRDGKGREQCREMRSDRVVYKEKAE